MGRPKKPPKPPPPGVKISVAAQQAGVSIQTVEYYVMLGLVDPIRPDGGSRRFFDDALIERIKMIHHLNKMGYTLLQIRTTFPRVVNIEREQDGR